MTAIAVAETSSTDDTSVVSTQTHTKNSTTTTDSSTMSNGAGILASQEDTRRIYDLEDKSDVNFERLRDDLKTNEWWTSWPRREMIK